jgi:hypothetical protein
MAGMTSSHCHDDDDGHGDGGDLSWSQTSESEVASTTKDRLEKEMQSSIARREERTVGIVRILVLVAIICAATAVSVAVYFFATESDTTNFELQVSPRGLLCLTSIGRISNRQRSVLSDHGPGSFQMDLTISHVQFSCPSQYYGYVNDIQSLIVWEVKYNMALLEQLSGTSTSTALMTDQTFPNVTQPNFEITGGFVDGMGGIMMALTAPLIAASNREAWEHYSVDHQGWIDESAYLKANYQKHRNPLIGTIQDHESDRRLQKALSDDGSPKIPTKIWKWDGDEKVVTSAISEYQVFAPLWQSSPANAAAVNVDLFSDSHIADLYTAMIKTQQTVMSPGIQIGNLFDWMFDANEKDRMSEPHAFIMEPLLSNFTGSPDPVGFVLALTSYKNLFSRLLPMGANGVYCVLSNNCGVTMTFLLNGPEAVFLGWEDLHEGFEEYEHVVQLELYKNYTKELCVHDLHIYPSATFQESYETNKPA